MNILLRSLDFGKRFGSGEAEMFGFCEEFWFGRRLGLVKDDAHNRDKWKSLTTRNSPTLPQCGIMDCVL